MTREIVDPAGMLPKLYHVHVRKLGVILVAASLSAAKTASSRLVLMRGGTIKFSQHPRQISKRSRDRRITAIL